ncbi:MAG: hypothetical protein WBV94_10920 [Blastocatellia bacterium]
MKERNCFENEMRALGIYPAGKQNLRPAAGGQKAGGSKIVRVEREFFHPDDNGGSSSGGPPRLSKGALGEAFAELQNSSGIPDEAIIKLAKTQVFQNWMVKDIDKNYVAVGQLMAQAISPNLNSEGRMLNKGSLKNRRVLFVQSSAALDFRRALYGDHTRAADIAECDLPKSTNLEKEWIKRIVLMVGQIRNEAVAKRKKTDPLDKRIKALIKEQVAVRRNVDNVLRDLDSHNPGFNFGLLFDGLTLQEFVEISYHPLDFLLGGRFILTNLEYYALLECMDEARRQAGLKVDQVDDLVTQSEAKPVGGSIEDLGKELDALKPMFKKVRGKLVLSGFENFHFARRLINRRWQMLNPNDPGHKDWRKDIDVIEMRRKHTEVIFPPDLKYLLP